MLLRYAHRLLAPLLALAATSCAPTYLLGVQPASPNTLYASGQPQASTTADGVALQVSFLGYEPDYLVFNAEYRNESTQPIEIAPTAFAAAPVRQTGVVPPTRRVQRGERVPAAVAAATQQAAWPALPPAPLPALDPEPQIVHLQDGAGHEAAKATRPDWVGATLLVVALGFDIASSARGSETVAQAQARTAIQQAAVAYNVIASANRTRHAATAEVLAQRAELLRQFALRRVVLQPGQQVRGYVYLPRFDQADGLQVLAPLGCQQVALSFVQTHQRR